MRQSACPQPDLLWLYCNAGRGQAPFDWQQKLRGGGGPKSVEDGHGGRLGRSRHWFDANQSNSVLARLD